MIFQSAVEICLLSPHVRVKTRHPLLRRSLRQAADESTRFLQLRLIRCRCTAMMYRFFATHKEHDVRACLGKEGGIVGRTLTYLVNYSITITSKNSPSRCMKSLSEVMSLDFVAIAVAAIQTSFLPILIWLPFLVLLG